MLTLLSRRRWLQTNILLALVLSAAGCSRRRSTHTPADRAAHRPPAARRATKLTLGNTRGIFRHFQPELRVFHWGNAYLAAVASLAAYELQDEQTRKIIRNMGFSKVTFVNRGTTQGFVASTPQMVLVAFRGTEVNKWSDIKADGALCQRKALGGLVHTGFLSALELVWKEVLAAVKGQARLGGGDGEGWKPVWITGHSLGGALAMLATVRLDKAGVPVRGTITLGQPRVGDLAFSQAYPGRERAYRITNRGDPVPLVPVRAQWLSLSKNKTCPFRYLHVGMAREFRKESKDLWKPFLVKVVAKTAPKAGESKMKWAARAIGAFFRKMGSMFTVTRHMMPAYLRNIWSQVPARLRSLLPAASSL